MLFTMPAVYITQQYGIPCCREGLVPASSKAMQSIWVIGLIMCMTLMVARPVRADAFRDRYDEGIALIKADKLTQSIHHFRDMLEENRTSYLSDNCQYWIAEAYYRLGDYEQAVIEFDRVFIFENNNKREDAFFRLGVCYEKLNDPVKAREIFKRFLAEYPESRHYKRVTRKLEALGGQ
ncbi:tetratricopeptide repeat protein [bacterium]|nr:tetratricopeptide repeat protein [bacterium]